MLFRKLFLFSLVFLLSCKTKKMKADIVGSFNYEIVNDSVFKKSFLNTESFGYVISNLEIEKDCGVKLIGIDRIINSNDDFIITLNYPILEINLMSNKIRNEGVGTTTKKPLDIVLDKSKNNNKVYIYRLDEKGKYRLLFG